MKYPVLATLLLATAASAANVVPLEIPRNPTGATQQGHCTADQAAFNADGTIEGTCIFPYNSVGRFVKPAVVYQKVTWDRMGNPTLGSVCADRAQYLSIVPPVDYESGFSEANCDWYPGAPGTYGYYYGVQGYLGTAAAGEQIVTYVEHSTLITF